MLDNKKICICIPARYHSQRLPGKPLAKIGDKSMIVVVSENMSKSKLADKIIVLTDSQKIIDEVENHGFEAQMTKSSHKSGTERITEFSNKTDYDIYLNVQGDEPLVSAVDVDDFIKKSYKLKSSISTPIRKIIEGNSLFDYNTVKCVKDKNNKALYFSRQAIPAQRDNPYRNWIENTDYFQHIGIYYFTKSAIEQIEQFEDTFLSNIEQLEQLKWLENGMAIHCLESKIENLSIDTQENLDHINSIWPK